ncbi:PTS sugar transporter subunit IIC, partial [Listeria monocytogenes]|nr:PTS sugar transporter subunit IIC [Listeria monocytogenes]HDU0895017.1 PTS sugar transporter subunit IIC [Listeria monocytogenes]HDU0895035.1 PTS sugar transporter subunit IIC [Listeria monocytogenes]
MSMNLVSIPAQSFLLWYMPYPVTSYLATQDFRGVIACLAIIVITWLVYLPFFKAYDNSLLKQEKLDAVETEKEMVTN